MSERLATEVAEDEPSGRQASLWSDAWRELRHDKIFVIAALVVLVFVTMAAFPRLFTSADPRQCDLSRSLGRPSADHWFGFDLLGCDYYAQVIHGARASITIGIVVTISALVIAILLGSLAGYYGGILDALIARFTDIIFGLPFILGAIVILTVFETRGLPQVSFVLAVLGWTTMTRLVRSSVLSARDNDYVVAARALGAGDLRLLWRHILPNALAPVIVYATIYVGIVIAAEATLSFLGVGLQLPAISWGLMISDAQYRIAEAPHLLFFPGLLLSLTVLSFILMGDALRDALDPKLR
ncbi:ABC transporter permease [Kribbella deserti]|uniref:ABC transporter permease n=1 Tax=Kribbella deserti TaxID=1926257 RepID=A0ABV6QFH9_9ACTN